MATAFKYQDNIDTDVIIPARYLTSIDGAELAAHCMVDLDPHFAQQVKPGDIMVAGSNFGCGSSREHAPIALKASGLQCIIAKSYARIFYRNSFNIGFPILECPEAAQGIAQGDEVTVDLASGLIENRTTGASWTTGAIPPFMDEIVQAGGLVSYLKSHDASYPSQSGEKP